MFLAGVDISKTAYFIKAQIVWQRVTKLIPYRYDDVTRFDGSDLFTPQVSVWADLEQGCLRGWARPYTGRRAFVGNGTLLVTRADVFRDNKRGTGVQMLNRNCLTRTL